MTFQFNNLEDSDHLEFDQLRTDHNITKILQKIQVAKYKNTKDLDLLQGGNK